MTALARTLCLHPLPADLPDGSRKPLQLLRPLQLPVSLPRGPPMFPRSQGSRYCNSICCSAHAALGQLLPTYVCSTKSSETQEQQSRALGGEKVRVVTPR